MDKGYIYQHSAEFIADNQWNIDHIIINYHGGGLTRTQFIDRDGDTYSCLLSTGDGRTQHFGFAGATGGQAGADKYDISYNLLAFSIPIFSKLNLRRGDYRDVRTILIEPSSLKAFDAKFRYNRLEDAMVTVPAGKFYASKYCVSDCLGEHKRFCWVDINNLIICLGDNLEGNNIYQLSSLIRGSDAKINVSFNLDNL